ncbi:zinc-dependent alcohol dehydrogenase family protein [Amycolatopsis thermophila]|uniref:NADPH:quinone reductase-like Zn-dependent oxidoreductase n=1 Tax=Amycolatopsis thermophila TaxID=206084 RepID=A0ABU0F5F5_9PSEU|nr:NAD(P)-dependent alcohol dehydrogenase [Amycolatopsis thermophila]MDQ0382815.1 NADPH:quinone reductase-like Zn-dependent oxidoreductase [Amycolatopsis thermophila]
MSIGNAHRSRRRRGRERAPSCPLVASTGGSGGQEMRAYRLRRHGTSASPVREDIPEPGPLGTTDVRVRIRACSLNFRDLKVAQGAAYGPEVVEGLVPLSDASGEVVEVGSEVWAVGVGDRVALTFNPDWDGGDWEDTPSGSGRGGRAPGVLCEEVVVGQREVVRLAPHLTFEEGATLPCAAVTAWSALRAGPALLPGDTVLTQGTGGVSLFVLQLAKLFGARVIITSSTEKKLARAAELGADWGINYREHRSWHEAVLAATGGRGADRVVDLGGRDTIEQSMRSVRLRGTVCLVGVLSGAPSTGEIALNSRFPDIHSIKVGSRQEFDRLMTAVGHHGLAPVIDRVFPFDEGEAAYSWLREGGHFGKVVITVD